MGTDDGMGWVRRLSNLWISCFAWSGERVIQGAQGEGKGREVSELSSREAGTQSAKQTPDPL